MEKWKHTPWGHSQHQETLAPGIVFHGTASHGGIWVDTAHAEKLEEFAHKNWLKSDTWWEEDCDWAIPYFIFRDEIKEYGKRWNEKELEDAIKTIRACHPHVVAKHWLRWLCKEEP
jgi:hypothetical protein